MLRYTTESLSKYWDDTSYRIFTFKMNSDGNLIIISSNHTNCNLYGFSDQCIGKNLYEVMAPEHAARWHHRFSEWKERGLISYIAQFEDTSEAWDTTIEIVDNTLFGIGKRITTDQLYQVPLENHELFNHFLVMQEDFIVITLQAELESNQFIIEAVDCNSSLGLDAFIGKDISAITYHCSNILDKKVYIRSLQSNKVIHFLEHYYFDDESIYLDIQLIPIVKISKILLFAKRISPEKYKVLQNKLSLSSSIYPESNRFGVCEINIENKNDPHIIGCNSYFKKLLMDTNIKLSSLITSSAFKQCILSLSTESGKIALKNNIGESIRYELMVSHKPELQANSFIVILSPEEKSIANFDLALTSLSTRQQEIISYVANGFTNRYIANKLNISEGTVKKTIYNSYKKLGIVSRVELVKLLNL